MDAGAHDRLAKQCPTCQRVLPRTRAFWYRDKQNRDGLVSTCKACVNDRRNKGGSHAARIRERRWREKGIRTLEHGKFTDAHRESLFVLQRGRCEICEDPIEIHLDGVDTAKVDHAHYDGKVGPVRGLLCSRHNLALGLFMDRCGELEAAMAYLKRHRAIHAQHGWTVPEEPC